MKYKILFSKSAVKELEKLGSSTLKQIINKISALADTPRPSNCKKLKGFEDLYRIRNGDYRIIYSVDDNVQIVDIRKVSHRKDAYQ